MRLVYLATLFILSAVAPYAVTAAAVKDNCNGTRQRQEIRNLTGPQRTAFINALKSLQSGKQPTVYDNYSKIHFEASGPAHSTAWFFSWHRAYLREFEKKLQAVNPSVTLPYWYWAYDSQAPEKSPVFTDEYFGGNGQPGDGCVATGQFSSWKPFYPNSHCLVRKWSGGNSISAFAPIDVVDSYVSTSRDYNELRDRIESNPHGAVHMGIGADMSTMYSPNDPIFYLHHAYIDKIWADWQARSPANANSYTGQNGDKSPARLSDKLTPFTYTVQDVLKTTDLCYTYAEFQPPSGAPTPRIARRADGDNSGNNTTSSSTAVPGNATSTGNTPPASNDSIVVGPVTDAPSPDSPVPPHPEDRTELIALRAPSPLPEDWIKLNGLSTQTVRQYETEQAKFVSQLNTIPGYVSPCALLRRPRVLAKIAKPGTYLTATKAGRRVSIRISDTQVTNSTVRNVVTQVDDKLDTSEAKRPADTNDKLARLIGRLHDATHHNHSFSAVAHTVGWASHPH